MPALTYPIPVANGAITPPAGAIHVHRLRGFSLAETSGTATAKVRLRDGTSSGQVLASVTLAAGESVRDWFGEGVLLPSQVLYVEVVSGAVEGSVYVGV